MQRAFSLDWSPNAPSPITQKSILQKYTKEIEHLKEDLQNETIEKEDLYQENSRLLNKLNSLEQQLKLKNRDNERLKDELDTLQSTLEEYASNQTANETVKRLNMIVNDLRAENEACKKYSSKLEIENENYQKCIQDHKKEVEKFVNDYINIEKECETFKKNLACRNDELNWLHNQVENLKSELRDQKELNRELIEENLKLESKMIPRFEQVENLGRELEFQDMKERIDSMTNEMDLVVKRVDVLKGEKEQFKQNLEEYRHLIESCNHEKEMLETRLIAEKTEVEQKLNGLVEEHRSLSSRFEDKCASNTILEVRLHDMSDQYEKLKLESNVLNSDYEALVQNCKKYATLLQESESKLKITSSTKINLEKELEKSTERLELLDEKCATLEGSLLDSSNNVKLLEDENNRLSYNIEQLKSNYETVLKENQSLKERLGRMDIEFATQFKKLKNMDTSLKNKEAQLEDITKQHQILIEEHRELQENNVIYAKLLETANEKLVECEKELQDRLTKLETITDECQGLKIVNIAYEAQISKLESELEIEKTKCQNVIEKLAETEQRANTLMEKNESLEKREQELVDYLNRSKIACNELSAENRSLISQMEVTRSEHDRTSEQYVQLEKNLQDARREFEQLLAEQNDHVAEIEADKNQLIKNYESLHATCCELTAEMQNIIQMNDQLSQLLKQTEDEKLQIENRIESLETDKLRLIDIDKAQREHNKAQENRLVELETTLKILRMDLAERDASLKEINDHYAQSQANWDACKKQLSEANALSYRIKIEKTEIEAKLLTMEEALSSCKANLEAANTEMAALKTTYERTKQQNENYERILEESTNELNTWMKNADKLKFELESIKEENQSLQTLRNTLSELQEELKNKDNETSNLRNTLDMLHDEKITLEKSLEDRLNDLQKLEKQVSQLENCVLQSKNQLSDLAKENDLLKEEKAFKESSLQELREKLRIQTTQCEKLEKEKMLMECIVFELKNKFEQLSGDNLTSQKAFEDLQQKKKTLEESLLRLEEDLRKQCDVSEQVEIALESERAENTTVKNTLQERTSEMQKMNENVLQFAEKCQRLEQTIRTLSQEKIVLEKSLQENARQSEQVVAKMETTKRVYSELKSTKDDLECALTRTRNENLLLQMENSRLHSEHERVRNECEKLKEIINEHSILIDSLRKDKEVHDSSFSAVESKLTASNKELNEARVQIYHLRVEHEKTLQQMADNDRQVMAENCRLIEQLEQARNELNDALRVCEDADLSKRSLHCHIENLEKRLRDLSLIEKEKSILQQRNREFEEQIKSTEELRATLLYEIERSQRSIEEAKNENQELVLKNSEKLIRLKKVEKRFEELSQEMITLREAYEEREKVVAELTANNASLHQEIEETQKDQKELKKLLTIESETAQTFKNELEEMKTRIADLSKEKEEFYKMESINSEAFEILKNSLTNELQDERTRIKALSDHLKSVEKEKNKLETYEKRLQEQVKTLSAALDEEKSRNVIMEEKLRKRTETDSMSDKNSYEVDELKTQLEAEKERLHKKICAMEKELQKEKEAYTQKGQKLYERVTNKLTTEFEGKLERAKTEYQKILNQKYATQINEWSKKEDEYKKMLKKEKEHIRDLSSQMWDVSDKYLQLKQKLEIKGTPSRFRTFSVENISSPSMLTRKARSVSQLNLAGGRNYGALDINRRLSAMSEDLPPPSFTRQRQTLTTSGKKFSLSSAKVFPTEDEEQEIFDNACLADLKHGRTPGLDSSDFSRDRLSVLQARNSLCPPHLKSSYPAETQFIPLHDFRENDIKMGSRYQNNESDEENLLPRDSIKKRPNQTSYKKPGPPTPSKNGGRSSQSECNGGTPRNVLRELNDNSGTSSGARRKSCTPKFFNIFSLRGHATVTMPSSQNDENSRGTPIHNRLSSIRRRLTKNTREQGNANNAYY